MKMYMVNKDTKIDVIEETENIVRLTIVKLDNLRIRIMYHDKEGYPHFFELPYVGGLVKKTRWNGKLEEVT